VVVFVTGEAARFMQDPEFAELITTARVGICEVSCIAAGFQGLEICCRASWLMG
jgi:hypothetical protein